MKLLVVTQSVDVADPILGFFCSWLQAFGSRTQKLTVLGQRVAEHNLPGSITVHSLGKEQGDSRGSQIRTFWKLIWQTRKDYDAVLVHMTPIWILLGAPIWLLLRKRMYLWYEIKRGSWKLSAAVRLVQKVFAATEHGLPAVHKKQVTVGHGIDTALFAPAPDVREHNHIIAVGRITRIKHIEQMLHAVASLPECRLTLAGGTVTEGDTEYANELQALMHRLQIADKVEMGWVGPKDIALLMQRADCMLHASQGGLDKAVLQAMACGTPVISCSEAAVNELPEVCRATAETLGEVAAGVLALSESDRKKLSDELREHVVQNHSLERCIERLVVEMS